MKLAKKITSIVSAAAMLASFAALNVDAAGKNQYSVSYETLTQTVETSDGTVIPAGAVAVSIAISGNTGFVADTLTLDIADGYTAVTNSDGSPVVETGIALETGLAAAAVTDANDAMCIAMATPFTCTEEGNLVTVYFQSGSELRSTGFIQITVNQVQTAALTDTISSLYDLPYYILGDTDGDEIVNSVDASKILYAVYNHGGGFYFTNIATYNDALVRPYFPDVVHYNAPNADRSNSIDDIDASVVLNYAANAGLYENYSDPYIGQKYYFIPYN